MSRAKKYWTASEVMRLEDMLASGNSYRRIASRLQRSIGAIQRRAEYIGMRLTKQPRVYTAIAAGALFGHIREDTMLTWIRHGYMKAANSGAGRHGRWHITEEALLVFIDNADYWMLWQPSHLTDGEWRAYATEIRHGQPAWLSIREVAERCYVSESTVKRWIDGGSLPAVRRLQMKWVRETDVLRREAGR